MWARVRTVGDGLCGRRLGAFSAQDAVDDHALESLARRLELLCGQCTIGVERLKLLQLLAQLSQRRNGLWCHRL